MNSQPPTSECPRCGGQVTWNERFPDRPFCSERCKLIDLGAWLTEAHRIPGEEDDASSLAEQSDG